ncbi:MAG: DUF4956 domain-containing protein [Clostridia bacterium]|nr:DUF4956 domain-containing protein [Clostridia bacterium]
METFQEFFTALTTANSGINLLTITTSVLVGVLLGIVVLLAHKFTGDEYTYDKNFGLVLLFIPATVALLISTTTSIIAALSIAGVLAIIRYRSTLTNPRDLAFIFFSVAVGFAAGLKLYLGALIFVVIGVIVSVVYALITADKAKNVKKTLKIAVPESIDYDGVFEPVLQKYTNSHKLVGLRVISGGTLIELTYSIKLKDAKDTKAFIDELRTLNANFKLSIQEYLPEPF